MNEKHLLQKIFAVIYRRRIILYLLIAFTAGCSISGFFFSGQGSPNTGSSDRRYAHKYRRATEIIGKLETELKRERILNNELQEHNNRARELVTGLTDSTDRNVRNLSDAIILIQEIRLKLKVLADFYSDSDTNNGSHKRH